MLNRIMAAVFALIGFSVGGALTGILNFSVLEPEAVREAVEAPVEQAVLGAPPFSQAPPVAQLRAPSFDPAAPAALAEPAAVGPAIWRVRDDDSVMWLFGTIHALSEDVQWRDPRIDAAFAEAATIYFESDVAAEQNRRTMRKVERLATYRSGPPLTERLSRNGKMRLLRTARKLGLDQSALIAARPWSAGLTIGQAMAEKAGMKAELGVEAVLGAEVGEKSVKFLEDGAQVLLNMAQIDDEAQLAEFETALRILVDNPYQTDFLQEAWRDGDLAALKQMTMSQMPAGSEMYRVMIRDRNRAWTPKLVEELQGEGVSFVAVGAAHLIGPHGLPRLLSREGYEVRRF